MKLSRFILLSLGLAAGFATAEDSAYDEPYTGSVWAKGVTEDGGWYDINKSSLEDEHVEANMCYAAAATNLIAWWQNGEYGVSSSAPTKLDDIWNVYVENNRKPEDGGQTLDAINWWVSGVYVPLKEENVMAEKDNPIWDRYYDSYENVVDADDSEDEGANEDDGMPQMSYAPTEGYYYDQYGLTKSDLQELLTDVWILGESQDSVADVDFAELFDNGACLSLAIVDDADELAHAITLWGAEYKDGELTALWLTDSDDFKEEVFSVAVTFDTATQRLYFGKWSEITQEVEGEDGEMIEVTQDCYYDATMGENAYICGIYALNASASANWKLVPEPTTATLSLLALAGMAMRRRRK